MAYYTKNTDRMDLHIEEYRGTILIQEKWKYEWLNASGTSPWSYTEKKSFHSAVDNIIWRDWGTFFYLKVRGTSDFAKKHIKTKWDVNFDIKWVSNSEHWTVKVTKYPINYQANPTSSVRWNSRIINLDTKDTATRTRNNANKIFKQIPVSHEFGHTAGNSIFASRGMHGDEYESSSPFYNDKRSLMNIGNQLRMRHIDYILKQLNTMLPNTIFYK